MNPIKKTFQYGAHQVTLETGEIARQAGGAVMITDDVEGALNRLKPGIALYVGGMGHKTKNFHKEMMNIMTSKSHISGFYIFTGLSGISFTNL